MAPKDQTLPFHDGTSSDSKAIEAALKVAAHGAPVHIQVHDGDAQVSIPTAKFLLDADYVRHGTDLVLVGKDGHEVVLKGYFNTDNPPDLVASDSGATIDAHLAGKLAGPLAPGQYAQAGGGDALGTAIGKVATATGEVRVTHADGSKSTLHTGDPIYQGDQLNTSIGSNAGLTMADGSELSIGEGTRMVMDEFAYDPTGNGGDAKVDMVKGSATFVSGQISKTNPGAYSFKTPVTDIGIRGTAGGINVGSDGATTAALLPEVGGTGELSIGGAVLNVAGVASSVSSAGAPPSPPTPMSSAQFGAVFGSALAALPNAAAHIEGAVLQQATQGFQQQQQQQQQQNQQLQQQQGAKGAAAAANGPAEGNGPQGPADPMGAIHAALGQLLGMLKGPPGAFGPPGAPPPPPHLPPPPPMPHLGNPFAAEDAANGTAAGDITTAQHDADLAANLYANAQNIEGSFSLANASASLNALSVIDASLALLAQDAQTHANNAQTEAEQYASASGDAANAGLAASTAALLYAEAHEIYVAVQAVAAGSLSPQPLAFSMLQTVHQDSVTIAAESQTLSNDQGTLTNALDALTELRSGTGDSHVSGVNEMTALQQNASNLSTVYGDLYTLAEDKASVYDTSLALAAWQAMDGTVTNHGTVALDVVTAEYSLTSSFNVSVSVSQTLTLDFTDTSLNIGSSSLVVGTVSMQDIDTALTDAAAASGASRVSDVETAQTDAADVLAQALTGFQHAYALADQVDNGTTLTAQQISALDPSTLSADALVSGASYDAAVKSWYTAWEVASIVQASVGSLSTSSTPSDTSVSAALQVATSVVDDLSSLETYYNSLITTAESATASAQSAYDTDYTAYTTYLMGTYATIEKDVAIAEGTITADLAVVNTDISHLTTDQSQLASDMGTLAMAEVSTQITASSISAQISSDVADAQNQLQKIASALADASTLYSSNPGNTQAILADVTLVQNADNAIVADLNSANGLSVTLGSLSTTANAVETSLTNAGNGYVDAATSQSLASVITNIGKAVASAASNIQSLQQDVNQGGQDVTLATLYDPAPLDQVETQEIAAAASNVSANLQKVEALSNTGSVYLESASLAASLLPNNAVANDYAVVQNDISHLTAAQNSLTVLAQQVNDPNVSLTQAQGYSDQATILYNQAANYAAQIQTDLNTEIKDAISAGTAIISQVSASIAADLGTAIAQTAQASSSLNSASADLQVMYGFNSATIDSASHSLMSDSAAVMAAASSVINAYSDATSQLSTASAALASLAEIGGAAVTQADAAKSTFATLTGEVGTIHQDASTAGSQGYEGSVQDYGSAGSALGSAYLAFSNAESAALSAASIAVASAKALIAEEEAAQAAADSQAQTITHSYALAAESATGITITDGTVSYNSTSVIDGVAQDAHSALAVAQTDFSNGDYSVISTDATAVQDFVSTVQTDFNDASTAALGHQTAIDDAANAAVAYTAVEVFSAEAQAMATAAADAESAATDWLAGTAIITSELESTPLLATATNALSTALAAETSAISTADAAQTAANAPQIAYAAAAATEASYLQSLETALVTFLTSVGETPADTTSISSAITAVNAYAGTSLTYTDDTTALTDIYTAIVDHGTSTLSLVQQAWLTGYTATYEAWDAAENAMTQASANLSAALQYETITNSQALAAESAVTTAEASVAEATANVASANTTVQADQEIAEQIANALMSTANSTAKSLMTDAASQAVIAQNSAAISYIDEGNNDLTSASAAVTAASAAVSALYSDYTQAESALTSASTALSLSALPTGNVTDGTTTLSIAEEASAAVNTTLTTAYEAAVTANTAASLNLARIAAEEAQIYSQYLNAETAYENAYTALTAGTEERLALAQSAALASYSAALSSQSSTVEGSVTVDSVTTYTLRSLVDTDISSATASLHGYSSALATAEGALTGLTASVLSVSLSSISAALVAVSPAIITVPTSVSLDNFTTYLNSATLAVSSAASTVSAYSTQASTDATTAATDTSLAHTAQQAANSATDVGVAATDAQTAATDANAAAAAAQDLANLRNSLSAETTTYNQAASMEYWYTAAIQYQSASASATTAQGSATVAATNASAASTAATTVGTLYGTWDGNASAKVADATTYGQLQAAESAAQNALAQLNSASAALSAALGSSSATASVLGESHTAMVDYAATALLAESANALAAAQAEAEVATAASAANTYAASVTSYAATIASDSATIAAELTLANSYALGLTAATTVLNYVNAASTFAAQAAAANTDASTQAATAQKYAQSVFADIAASTSGTADLATASAAVASATTDYSHALTYYTNANASLTLAESVSHLSSTASSALIAELSVSVASASASLAAASQSLVSADSAYLSASSALANSSNTAALISALHSGVNSADTQANSIATDAASQKTKAAALYTGTAGASATLTSLIGSITTAYSSADYSNTATVEGSIYAKAETLLSNLSTDYTNVTVAVAAVTTGSAAIHADNTALATLSAISSPSAANLTTAQSDATDANNQMQGGGTVTLGLSQQDQVAQLNEAALSSGVNQISALSTAYAQYNSAVIAATQLADASLVQAAEKSVATFSVTGGTTSVSENVISSGTLTTHSVTFVPTATESTNSYVTNQSLTLLSASASDGTVSVSGGTLTYKPTANFYGTDTITFTELDTATITLAGYKTETLSSQSTGTVTISVNHVEQQSTLSPISFAAAENGTLVIGSSAITAAYSSPDSSTMAKVEIASLPTEGTLTLNGTALTGTTVISASALSTLDYIPTSGYTGTDKFTIESLDSFSINGTPTLGTIWSAAATVSLNVSFIEQVTTLSSFSETAAENSSLSLGTSVLVSGFSNSNGVTVADSYYDIVTLPGHGTLTSAGTVITAGTTLTAAQFGALVYTPTTNYSGTDSFTLKSQEGYISNGTLTEGSLWSTVATASLTVTYVEQSLTLATMSHTTSENTSLTLGTATVATATTLPGSAEVLDEILIASTPTHGTLTLNGTVVNANTTLSLAQYGSLVFTPTSGYEGTAAFTIEALDGHSVNGSVTAGTLWSAAQTVTVNITELTQTISGHSFDLSTVASGATEVVQGTTGGDTIYTNSSDGGIVTLVESGRSGILNVSGIPQDGFLGAYQSGNNAVFQLTSAAGGGELIVQNQFSTSTTQGLASIVNNNGTTTLVGSNQAVNGTITTTGNNEMILANEGESVSASGSSVNIFAGGGNQSISGNDSSTSVNFDMAAGSLTFHQATQTVTNWSSGTLSHASDIVNATTAVGLAGGGYEEIWYDYSQGMVYGEQFTAGNLAVGSVTTLANVGSVNIFNMSATAVSGGFAVMYQSVPYFGTNGSVQVVSDIGGSITAATVSTAAFQSFDTALASSGGTALNAFWQDSLTIYQESLTAGSSLTTGPSVFLTVSQGTTVGGIEQATLTGGGSVVAWAEYSNQGAQEYIQGSNISATLVSSIDGNVNLAVDQIAAVGSGFVLAGFEYVNNQGYIVVDKFTANGSLTSSAQISLGSNGYAMGINLTALSGGGYVVGYTNGGEYNAVFNANNVLVNSPTEISTANYSYTNPLIALSGGGYVESVQSGQTSGVTTQVFDASGNAVNTAILTSGTTTYTDNLSGVSQITGTTGNDSFALGAGTMTFMATGGNDTYTNTGTGSNTVSYLNQTGPVTIVLGASGSAVKSDGSVDTLTNVTSVIGSTFADTITAANVSAGSITIEGGGAADTLIGGGTGSNVTFIVGSQDGATITGGSGTNTLEFQNLSTSESSTFTIGTAADDTISGIQTINLTGGSVTNVVTSVNAAIVASQQTVNGVTSPKSTMTIVGGSSDTVTLNGNWAAKFSNSSMTEYAGTGSGSYAADTAYLWVYNTEQVTINPTVSATITNHSYTLSGVGSGVAETLTSTTGADTISVGSTAFGTVYLAETGQTSILNATAVPQGEFQGAYQQGNNAILQMNNGGELVIENQFATSNAQGIAGITGTNSTGTMTLVGSNQAVNGTITATGGNELIMANLGESTVITSGNDDTIFAGGGSQVLVGSNSFDSTGDQFYGAKVDFATNGVQTITYGVQSAIRFNSGSDVMGNAFASPLSGGGYEMIWLDRSYGWVEAQQYNNYDVAVGSVTTLAVLGANSTFSGSAGTSVGNGFAVAFEVTTVSGNSTVTSIDVVTDTTGTGGTGSITLGTLSSGLASAGNIALTSSGSGTVVAGFDTGSNTITVDSFAVGGTGTLVSSGTVITTSSTADASLYLGSSGSLVVWQSNGSTYVSDSAATSSALSAIDSVLTSLSHANVAAFSSGGFVVAGVETDPYGNNYIVTEKLDANGNIIASNWQQTSDTAVGNVRLTTISGGGYAVDWLGTESGTTTIQAQVYSPTGDTPNDAPISVYSTTISGTLMGKLVALSDGSVILPWSNNSVVYAQHLDANGDAASTVTLSGNGSTYTDSLFNINTIVGTAGNDTFVMGPGNTWFGASAGNDTYNNSQGQSTGGVSYQDLGFAVTINLASDIAYKGSFGVDNLINVTSVQGSGYGDTITAGNVTGATYYLDSGGGAAHLYGGTSATDFVIGANDGATVAGGSGYTQLSFETTPLSPSGSTYSLTAAGTHVSGVDDVQMWGGAVNTLLLNINSAIETQSRGGNGTSGTLTIDGISGDTVVASGTWILKTANNGYNEYEGLGTGSLAGDTVYLQVNDQISTSITAVSDSITVAGVAASNTVIAQQGMTFTPTISDILGNSVTTTASAIDGSVVHNANGSYTYVSSPDFVGTDTLTFTSTDGIVSTTTTSTIVVTDHVVQSLAPETVNTGSSIALAYSISDAAGMAITPTFSAQHGSISDINGTYYYTPNANFTGTDTLTMSDVNASGGVTTSTAQMTVTNGPAVGVVNVSPSMTAYSGQGYYLFPYASDSYGDPTNLTVTAQHGQIYYYGGNEYQYVPNFQYLGTDTITYTVTDLTYNKTASVTSSVSVLDMISASMPNETTTINTPVDLSYYVSDAAGLATTVSFSAANGTVSDVNGTYVYTPSASYQGTDSVVMTATNADGQTQNYTAYISVEPPVEIAMGLVDPHGVTGGTIAIPFDINESSQVTITTSPSEGFSAYGTNFSVANEGSEAFFTPNAGDGTVLLDVYQPGITTVTFTSGGSSTVTTFTVLPTMSENIWGQTSQTSPGTSVNLGFGLQNYGGYANGDTYTATIIAGNGVLSTEVPVATTWGVASSSIGAASVSNQGTVSVLSYNASYAGYNGTWDFTTTATQTGTMVLNWNYDGFHAWSSPYATISLIEHGAVDSNPIQSGSVYGDFYWNGQTTISVTAGEVYGFALSGSNYDSTDILEGSVTVSSEMLTTGTSTLVLTGTSQTISNDLTSLTYTPNTGYDGTDTIQATIQDTTYGTLTPAVTHDYSVIVNNNNNNNGYNQTNTAYSGQTASGNVYTDYPYYPDNITVTSGPSHGTVSVQLNEFYAEYYDEYVYQYTYTPTASFTGTDSFVLDVVDPYTSFSQLETFVISVQNPIQGMSIYNVNYGGETNNGTISTSANVGYYGELMIQDAYYSPYTTWTLESGPSHGSLSLQSDGVFTYDPTAYWHGVDTFTVQVTDYNGNTATELVTVNVSSPIQITNMNAYGTASNTITAQSGTASTGTLSIYDTDEASVTTSLSTQAAHGTVTYNSSTLGYSYVANASYYGTDSFVIAATDGDSTIPTYETIYVNDVGVPGLANVTVNALASHTFNLDPVGLTQGTSGGDLFVATVTVGSGELTDTSIEANVSSINNGQTLVISGGYEGLQSALKDVVYTADQGITATTDSLSLVVNVNNTQTLSSTSTITVAAVNPGPILMPSGGYAWFNGTASALVDGGNDYVSSQTQNTTVEAAINWSGGTNNGYSFIFYNGNPSCSGDGLYISSNGALNLLVGGVNAGTAVLANGSTATNLITTGVWTDIALIENGSNWSVEVNGVSYQFSFTTATPNNPYSYAGYTYIGNAYSDQSEGFQGDIASVTFWNEVRSSSQIASDFLQSPVNDGYLARYFSFGAPSSSLQTSGVTYVSQSQIVAATNGQAVSGQILALDPTGSAITYALHTGPAHGTITLGADGLGDFYYTPSNGYYGADSFVASITANGTQILDTISLISAAATLAPTSMYWSSGLTNVGSTDLVAVSQQSLYYDLSTSTSVLSLEIENNAALYLTGGGTLNVLGTSYVDNSSYVQINGSSVLNIAAGADFIDEGGLNTSSGTITGAGTFTLADGYANQISQLTVDGNLVLDDTSNSQMAYIYGNLYGSGTVTNEGQLYFQESAEITPTFINAAGATLTLNGNLTFDHDFTNYGTFDSNYSSISDFGTFTNDGNFVSSGYSNFYADAVINNGTMSVENGNSLRWNVNLYAENNGTIILANNCALDVFSNNSGIFTPFINTGDLIAGDNSSIDLQQYVVNTMTSTGTIEIGSGQDYGSSQLYISGNAILESGSDLILHGFNNGYSHLYDQGTLTLGGTLTIDIVSQPYSYDQFQAISSQQSLIGGFDTINGLYDPSNPTYLLDPLFSGTSMYLTDQSLSASASSASTTVTGEYLLANAGGSTLVGENNENPSTSTGAVLLGQAGNDSFIVSTDDFHMINGGGGFNSLVWNPGTNSSTLDLSAVMHGLVENIQEIDLSQVTAASATVTLNSAQVLAMTQNTLNSTAAAAGAVDPALIIFGNSNEHVVFTDSGWSAGTVGTQTVTTPDSHSDTYTVYTNTNTHMQVLVGHNVSVSGHA